MNKDIQLGKWGTAIGGHIDYGESVEEALRRGVREELGITDFTLVFIKRYISESSTEEELVNSFRITYDGPITSDPEELDEGRFWPIEEIKESLEKGVFTPNFEKEFTAIFLQDKNATLQLEQLFKSPFILRKILLHPTNHGVSRTDHSMVCITHAVACTVHAVACGT